MAEFWNPTAGGAGHEHSGHGYSFIQYWIEVVGEGPRRQFRPLTFNLSAQADIFLSVLFTAAAHVSQP